MRFFANDLTGDEKMGSMVTIPFDKTNKNLREIYDDISSNYKNDVEDVNPSMLNNFILNHAK